MKHADLGEAATVTAYSIAQWRHILACDTEDLLDGRKGWTFATVIIISTHTFRRALTASVDSCAETKSVLSVA